MPAASLDPHESPHLSPAASPNVGLHVGSHPGSPPDPHLAAFCADPHHAALLRELAAQGDVRKYRKVSPGGNAVCYPLNS